MRDRDYPQMQCHKVVSCAAKDTFCGRTDMQLIRVRRKSMLGKMDNGKGYTVSFRAVMVSLRSGKRASHSIIFVLSCIVGVVKKRAYCGSGHVESGGQ